MIKEKCKNFILNIYFNGKYEEIFPDNFDFEKAVETLLKMLTPNQESILRDMYGLDDGVEKNLLDLSIKYGITRERVRQIEAFGIRRLKKPEYVEIVGELKENK